MHRIVPERPANREKIAAGLWAAHASEVILGHDDRVKSYVSTVVADDTPPFKITTKRDNDRVEVKTDKDETIFSVHSPFGISNTVIERSGDKWPEAVVLRLNLKGLENFNASN